jgi:hypothetical protein
MAWWLRASFSVLLGAALFAVALLVAPAGCGDDGAGAAVVVSVSSSETGSGTEGTGSTSQESDGPTTASSGSSTASTTHDTAGSACGENEFVQSSACVPCPAGTTNEPGDDPAGPDTMCLDPCLAALGVPCATFDEAYLKASNTDATDRFGQRVALAGDTLAVGAPGESSKANGVNGNQADDLASASGAVYVFRRSGSTWVQEAYLKASNTGRGDLFGQSVTLDGDTLAVGAYYEASNATGVNGNQADDSANGSGAVYVFRRSGSTWAQEAYLKASNTGPGDGFGVSVALDGDTLAVGAWDEDSNATGVNGDQADNSAPHSGSVYVFRRSGSTWAQEAYLKASNTDGVEDCGSSCEYPGDTFGSSVALEGDTLAVGARGEASNATGVNGNQADNSAFDSGAVYVFRRSGSTWAQEAYLKASNTGAGDLFGYSVALDGDILAVGAFGEASNATAVNGNQADNSATNSGAVYVFRRSGSAWAQEAYLKASNTGANDWFGFSVALHRDTLAVGAWYEASNATGVNGNEADNSATNSGAVYVFRRSGSTWAHAAYLKASNTEADDCFGYAVALSGDTLAVGAFKESSNATSINGDQADNSAPNSGAVYVRRIAP